jgi:UDP-galactopyranose mutase
MRLQKAQSSQLRHEKSVLASRAGSHYIALDAFRRRSPLSLMTWDYLIVGAGFSGAVLAERLASQRGATCFVIDRRSHIGGNAYDKTDPAGVVIHPYGPHYFRTNSDRVIEYLSRFTDWHHVEYKVLSWTDGRYWQFPINLNTFEQLLGRPSSSEEMAKTLAEWREPIASPKNSEEVIVSQVGRRLYEMFFQNYTRKQWRRDPRDLDPSVCGRIPVRTNRDDRFCEEKFQALPKDGYTAMFERILRHPKIELRLNADFRQVREQVRYRHLIYTGPIDEYFDHSEGVLPWRSLRFETETREVEFAQPAMQVNFPNDFDYTRVVEIKHATGQKLPVTTLVREYPQDFTPGSEPYYPIPAPDARALYARYAEKAVAEPGVTFVGRLATYRYYNMDQVVAAALAESERMPPIARP